MLHGVHRQTTLMFKVTAGCKRHHTQVELSHQVELLMSGKYVCILLEFRLKLWSEMTSAEAHVEASADP